MGRLAAAVEAGAGAVRTSRAEAQRLAASRSAVAPTAAGRKSALGCLPWAGYALPLQRATQASTLFWGAAPSLGFLVPLWGRGRGAGPSSLAFVSA